MIKMMFKDPKSGREISIHVLEDRFEVYEITDSKEVYIQSYFHSDKTEEKIKN